MDVRPGSLVVDYLFVEAYNNYGYSDQSCLSCLFVCLPAVVPDDVGEEHTTTKKTHCQIAPPRMASLKMGGKIWSSHGARFSAQWQ